MLHQDATVNSSPRRSVDSNRHSGTSSTTPSSSSSSTTRGAAILTNPNFRDYNDADTSPVEAAPARPPPPRTSAPPPYTTAGRSRTSAGKTMPSSRTTSNSNDPHVRGLGLILGYALSTWLARGDQVFGVVYQSKSINHSPVLRVVPCARAARRVLCCERCRRGRLARRHD